MAIAALYLLVTAVSAGIIIYVLVEYLVNQDGPKDVLKRFRKLVGVNRPVNKPTDGGYVTEYVSNETFLGDLFYCPYCLTPYMTAVIVALGIISGFIILDISVVAVFFMAMGTAVYLAKSAS